MTRRELLAIAGGAVVSSPAECSADAKLCCSSGWSWLPQAPPCIAAPNRTCQPGIGAKFPIAQMPPVGQKFIDFAMPNASAFLPRPLWSELKLKKNHRRLHKVEGDLERAYDKLLCMEDDDRRSLLYQTCLHAFYCTGLWTGGNCDDMRTASPFDIHMTWHFFPLHRALLYFHEQILARASRNPNFRLPVWDWETDVELPQFYIDKGLPNFLTGSYSRVAFDPASAKMLIGNALQGWLLSSNFENFCGNATPNMYLRCNAGPHDAVHTGVVQGAMSLFYTSAADPVFYAHHANIDRFWGYWLRYYKDYKRPDQWLNQCYYLYDQHERLVRMHTYQLLSERRLGYCYSADPAVPLYNFASHRLTPEEVADPELLIRFLELVTVGTLRADPQYTDQGLLQFVQMIHSGSTDPRLPSFPVRIAARVQSHKVLTGTYFPAFLGRSGAFPSDSLGGFSIMPHGAGRYYPTRSETLDALILGSIDATFLAFLRTQKGPLDLRYRLSSSSGTPVEQEIPLLGPSGPDFEILYPQGAELLAKEWLARQSISLPF
jgi:hypothetical protein